MQSSAADGFNARLRTWFHDREFFMRSQGQVRFIRFSARAQMIAAAAVAALLVVWLVTMAGMAVSQYISTRDRLALLDREAKVASSESRVASYRRGLDGVASDLEKRQDFIEKMVGTLPSDVRSGETVSDSSTAAAQTIDKVSAAVPEAAGLARLEARQLAFVERMTRFADRRSADAAARIRKLGLNPGVMLARLDSKAAMGGPLMKLATAADGSLDPRFQRFGLSLARMEALERGLLSIPQVSPTAAPYVSSSYGYRADPFTGGGAFHAGLDFPAHMGAPIYAAARGTVSFVGQKQGYGNVIEVTHGNGLMTRYAHMSGFRAQVGQAVGAGEQIGLVGNTGRSTGPHLHFEVRINDQPVNPRPFLEALPHVLEKGRP